MDLGSPFHSTDVPIAPRINPGYPFPEFVLLGHRLAAARSHALALSSGIASRFRSLLRHRRKVILFLVDDDGAVAGGAKSVVRAVMLQQLWASPHEPTCAKTLQSISRPIHNVPTARRPRLN